LNTNLPGDIPAETYLKLEKHGDSSQNKIQGSFLLPHPFIMLEVYKQSIFSSGGFRNILYWLYFAASHLRGESITARTLRNTRSFGGLRMTITEGLFLYEQPLQTVISGLFIIVIAPPHCHPMFVLRRKYPRCHEEASEVYPILWTEKR
jgi:hypothetical protein